MRRSSQPTRGEPRPLSLALELFNEPRGIHEVPVLGDVVILHADEDHAEYIEHRGVKETEAESVAYVVAGILGLDSSAYSIGYVAGWADGDTETIKSTAGRVLRAAHTLADAITVDHELVEA